MASGTDAVSLSLVLPAFNEAEAIGTAIDEARAALEQFSDRFEIIVVNDGSRDGTAAAVRRAATQDPRVRLVEHETNRGYGAAIRSGFRAARFPLVVLSDADCQFDLRELGELLPLASRHDIVCGYRIGRQDPAYRRFLSWGYNRLISLLLGSRVRDCDCALKIFRRDAAARVLPESDNFFANTEMLWRANRHGLDIAEAGVHHRPRRLGHSKVSMTDVPRTLRTLLPFWWSHVIWPRTATVANQPPLPVAEDYALSVEAMGKRRAA